MRITASVDPAIVEQLNALAHRDNMTLSAVINRLILVGLSHDKGPPRPFKVEPKSMGPPRVDLTHALRLAGELEDEEILRKMRQQK
jgi:hypothetical protein